MTSLRLFSALLLTSGALIGDAPCEVRIHLSDEYGNPVLAAQIKVVGAKTMVDAQPDKPFRIEEGNYTVQVTSPGSRRVTVPVVVDQLRQVIAVALPLGAVEGPVPTCAIYGRIASPVTASHVRLMELFGARLIDVPLEGASTFAFRSVACGTYLLVVTGPGSCLATMVVKASATMPRLDIGATELAAACGPVKP